LVKSVSNKPNTTNKRANITSWLFSFGKTEMTYKTKETAIKNLQKGKKFYGKNFDLFRDDEDVVLEAVKIDGFNLELAGDEIRINKKIVLEAVKQHGRSIMFASKELQDDNDVVLEAVKQDDTALWWASDRLKNDKEIVLEAVRQDEKALGYASRELQEELPTKQGAKRVIDKM
jgi:hypothetical protein